MGDLLQLKERERRNNQVIEERIKVIEREREEGETNKVIERGGRNKQSDRERESREKQTK